MNLVSTLVFVISFLLELQLQVYLTGRPRSKLVKQVQLSQNTVSPGFQNSLKKTFKANVTNYQLEHMNLVWTLVFVINFLLKAKAMTQIVAEIQVCQNLVRPGF